MKVTKQPSWGDLRVAIITLAAFLLIVFMIIKLDRNKGLFEGRSEIRSVMNDPRGLRNGAPVHLSGVEVGTVRTIAFQQDASVMVTLSVREDIRHLVKTSSYMSIETMGVLGDKYVLIHPGKIGDDALPDDDYLGVRSSSSMVDMVSDASAAVGRLKDAVEKVNDILDRVTQGNGTLSKLMNDSKVVDEAELLFTQLNQSLSGSGSLGRLVKDPKLYENLRTSTQSLAELLAATKEENSTVGKLMREDSLHTKVERVADQMEVLATQLTELVGDIKEHPKKYFSFSVF